MLSESPRVLVVERPADAADQISVMLATAGYMTRTVQTSESALDMLGDWHPQVLVVDMRVPNLEGRRFCASLAEQARASTVPVVLLGDLSNMMKAAPIVPFGLVSTPINGAQLAAAVRRAAAQQTHADDA
jgi:DNA-binding response OmpR family regulator